MKKLIIPIAAIVLIAGCIKQAAQPQQQKALPQSDNGFLSSKDWYGGCNKQPTNVSYEMIKIEDCKFPSIYPPTGKIADVCTIANWQFRIDLTIHKILGHYSVIAAYGANGDSLRTWGDIQFAGLQRWKMAWSHNNMDTPEENTCFKLVADGTYANNFKDGKVIDSVWYRCCDKCEFKN